MNQLDALKGLYDKASQKLRLLFIHLIIYYFHLSNVMRGGNA
jgi:hypothetical protein